MTTPRRIAVATGAGAEGADQLVGTDAGLAVQTVIAAQPSQVDAIDDRWIDALVCIAPAPDAELLAFIQASVARRPWLPVVVATGAGAAVRELLAAGAVEIVALPADGRPDAAVRSQLAFSIEKLLAQRGTGAGGTANALGQVVTILGPKGGTGKTLTTCNLSVALARSGKRVTVVDLDLQFGDVGLSLGIDPTHTVADLIASGGTIDADRLDSYVVTHDSGVRALLAPVRPDEAEAVTPTIVTDIIAGLRASNDVVIIDTPPGFTPAVIAAIDSSTSLCLVSMLDSLSLKNTRVALDTLALMGYPADSVQLVLNRADSDVGVAPSDVEALLGRRPDIMVPSSRHVTRAVNEGTPIVGIDPSSAAAQAFLTLAGVYFPAATPEPAVASNPNVNPRRRLGFAPGLRSIRKAVS